jgi:capsular exopolysaccharide synthesis family protein
MKRAETPSVPIEPLPLKELVAVLLASFGLPFGLAVLWERNARRITETEQLKQFGLPFVVEVAALPSGRKLDQRTMSPRTNVALKVFEESVDSLRTSLLLGEKRNPLQVILIASGASAEGKTSVAAQLTVAMARVSTEPVLLIDADMRSSDLQRILGVSCEYGLADVLRGACQADQAIVRDWDEHIHILTGGELRGSPHKLVANGAFEDLLNQLRRTYGRIIIDSPPILSASESLVMAEYADATLLCAMRGHSRMQSYMMAHERLAGIGVWPAGGVLNRVHIRQYTHVYEASAYDSTLAPDALAESST